MLEDRWGFEGLEEGGKVKSIGIAYTAWRLTGFLAFGRVEIKEGSTWVENDSEMLASRSFHHDKIKSERED